MVGSAASASPQATRRALLEVAWVFLRLGCTSFGGPIAHIGFFRAELVERRRWLDDAQYADVIALCQALPGPSSMQAVFALGHHRAGFAGALLASSCFTAPSVALMLAFAQGVAREGSLGGEGWLRGLKLAAVPIVAQAVWGMGRQLCPDLPRAALGLATAIAIGASPTVAVQLACILAGGVVGWWLYRGAVSVAALTPARGARHGRSTAALALLLFASLLASLPTLASATGWRQLAVFDAFYRAGALVFGGGHVVLPLLRAELARHAWLTDEQLLAGYGAAQALPGPLFAFAAYLGAVMPPGAPRWGQGLLCLFALSLPGWLLVAGALPYWRRLRASRWAQAALAGVNAAVVGVLLAALYRPIVSEGVRGVVDVVAAFIALVLLARWRAPPWLIVAGMAAAGQWLLPS